MTTWTRRDLTIFFAIVALACAAAYLSVKLTRAKVLLNTQISLMEKVSLQKQADLLGRARLTTVSMTVRL